jgi:hypothetical protein
MIIKRTKEMRKITRRLILNNINNVVKDQYGGSTNKQSTNYIY